MPTAAHQAIGRQRLESRLPSGKRSRRKVAGTRMKGIHDWLPYEAAASPSAVDAPAPLNQNSAYPLASWLSPAVTATERRIQPIALPGCLVAINVPTTAKTRAIVQMKTLKPAPPPKSAAIPNARPAAIWASASTTRPIASRRDVLLFIGSPSRAFPAHIALSLPFAEIQSRSDPGASARRLALMLSGSSL